MTRQTPADTVRSFYDAVAAKDVAAVTELVQARFHEMCSMTRPESMPGGGTVSGRSRLQRFLGGGTAADVGPADLKIATLAADQGEVVAELRFAWRSTPDAVAVETGAVEWWTFDEDGLVRSIRVYYADTARLAPPDPQPVR